MRRVVADLLQAQQRGEDRAATLDAFAAGGNPKRARMIDKQIIDDQTVNRAVCVKPCPRLVTMRADRRCKPDAAVLIDGKIVDKVGV